MNRETVLEWIRENKIVIILRGVGKEKVLKLAEALYEGGIRLVEVTFDQKKQVSDRETAEIIGELVRHFGDRMAIGAGTVLTKEQVQLVHEAGGTFIISPDVCEEVIRETRALNMVSLPGALTPTEIMTAKRFGADMVKLFPAGEMGISYIKAVKAPLSEVELIAVGGINIENIRDYAKAGVSGFGISTGILKKDLLEAENYEGIQALAKAFTEAVR